MNEEQRKEAQRRLNDEERVRRLREGGEEMKAQLAMEEAQRSSRGAESRESGSYLTPEEEQRRRMMRGGGEPYRGYGETQQAQMAMWGQRKEGGGEREEEPARRMLTEEEMRRTGSGQVGFPAGSGSYYSGTFERPTGSAGPESSFGRQERMPSGKQYAEEGMGAREGPSEAELMEGRRGERPSFETAPTGKMEQTTGKMKEKGGEAVVKGKEYGGVAVEKGKEYGGTVVEKTKEVIAPITTKAKEFNESNRAEDMASRAGEMLGKAIRKTVSVTKEMTSGVKRGLGQEGKRPPEGEERVTERRVEGERISPGERESVEREEISRETPTGEERRYQEVRRKQNE